MHDARDVRGSSDEQFEGLGGAVVFAERCVPFPGLVPDHRDGVVEVHALEWACLVRSAQTRSSSTERESASETAPTGP